MKITFTNGMVAENVTTEEALALTGIRIKSVVQKVGVSRGTYKRRKRHFDYTLIDVRRVRCNVCDSAMPKKTIWDHFRRQHPDFKKALSVREKEIALGDSEESNLVPTESMDDGLEEEYTVPKHSGSSMIG